MANRPERRKTYERHISEDCMLIRAMRVPIGAVVEMILLEERRVFAQHRILEAAAADLGAARGQEDRRSRPERYPRLK